MGTTPIYGLPYPEATDAADVPIDLQELALGVETDLAALADRVAALEAVGPSPGDLAYVEIIADVAISAQTAAAANPIMTLPAVVLTAAPHWIQAYAPRAQAGANSLLIINLWEDATDLGRISSVNNPATGGAGGGPLNAMRKHTPAAGSHTYSLRGWRDTANGLITAGAGGTGALNMPAFMRIWKP